MPRGPKGEKRPANIIAKAVMVARIATGEEEDTCYEHPYKVKGGRAGWKARAEKLTAEERKEIARKAAEARRG
jgi:hypothetical protein